MSCAPVSNRISFQRFGKRRRKPLPLDGQTSLNLHPGLRIQNLVRICDTPSFWCTSQHIIHRRFHMTHSSCWSKNTGPWHSQPVNVFSKKRKNTDVPTVQISEDEQQSNTQQLVGNRKEALARVARYIVLKPFTQHFVLVTKTSHGLLAEEPKQSSANYSMVATAIGVLDVIQQWPCFI